jgi:tRNA (uracil-5-)-methyltransferase TRM9
VSRALAKAGHQGEYVGVDASVQMLAIASQDCPHPHATFLHADLASPAWAAALEGRFDEILAFAVLHHLPGSTLRLRLTRQLHELLSPNGRLTLSVWNFSASSRLMKRIVPWEDVNLQAEDVDAGDALIDWRHGGRGLRYVHQFSVQELEALAQQACFAVDETYHSDGEGGRLGLYQVWLPAPQAQQE